MSDHIFRNPDKLQVLPFRDWLRRNKPNGNTGFIVEDLDLIIRLYGEHYHTDDTGKFMLVELKFFPKWIDRAQEMTFGLIDCILRLTNLFGKRYFGFFVIQYSNNNWDISKFWINKQEINRETLLEFFDMGIPIEPLKFRIRL